MMDTYALIAATAAMSVLVVIIAWYDLKYLRIPNWSVLAIIAVFLGTASWGLPLDTFLWRIGYGVIVLFVGYGLWSLGAGHVGGGDIKMTAALAPFVGGADLALVLAVFAICAIVGIVLHRFVRARLKGRQTGWKSLDQKRVFPVGLLLGISIMAMLLTEVAARLPA